MYSECPNLDQLAPHIVSLAEKAGEVLSSFYAKDIVVKEKADGSPVTSADLESHNLLVQGLTKLCPSIPIISEEDEASWKVKSYLYWLIDPLDGTKGFIQKTGEFCINIGLIDKRRPVFGLIHRPLTQDSLYGYSGQAWQSCKGKTSQLHTRDFPGEGGTLLLGGYGRKFEGQEKLFTKAFPISHIERIRSALKFCVIAEGKADIYVRFEKCGEWDTAAGQMLVEAAGGFMTNLDGSPFVYGKPGLINEGFVVFGRKP